jgi:hypothetical protein
MKTHLDSSGEKSRQRGKTFGDCEALNLSHGIQERN